MNPSRVSRSILSCSFQWKLSKISWLIVSSYNDLDCGYKSHQYLHLCPFLHLALHSPGSRDDSGLLTVFLLTSGIWFHLPLFLPSSPSFHLPPRSTLTLHYLLISDVNTCPSLPASPGGGIVFLADKSSRLPRTEASCEATMQPSVLWLTAGLLKPGWKKPPSKECTMAAK